jgi:hypothetical protein
MALAAPLLVTLTLGCGGDDRPKDQPPSGNVAPPQGGTGPNKTVPPTDARKTHTGTRKVIPR